MARHRAGSRLSFRRSSSSSIPHIEAAETTQEKHRFQVKGKADPSKAINEAEPAAVATSQVTMGKPLRDLEHRDLDGNLIVDPDRSNPTRPRQERPLDTIRSFEAAIDGYYHRRQSYRAETPNPISTINRRSGYFGGHAPSQRRGLSETGAFHGDRAANHRPDSYYENGNTLSTAYHGGNNRRFGPRNSSDPALYGNHQNSVSTHGPSNGPPHSIYPSYGHQQSFDTVGTLSNGSHVTEPWGNSTEPSSENSSIDRVHPLPKQDLGEAYGFNGFGGGPILEEYGHGDPGYGEPGYGHAQMGHVNGQLHRANNGPPVPQHGAAPPPPPKDDRQALARIASSSNGVQRTDYGEVRDAAPSTDKRKSWLKKRFSRS